MMKSPFIMCRVAGRAWLPALLVAALCASAVTAAASPAGARAPQSRRDLRPFSIRSGDFTLSYGVRDGHITVGRAGKSLSIATHLSGGELFRATHPQFARSVELSKDGDVSRVLITSERDWAELRGTVETYASAPGLIRFRLNVTTKRPTLIGDSAPEFSFVDPRTGRPAQARSTVFNQPGGIEAPVVYLYNEELDCSLVYMQNLTSLNEYLNYVQGDPRWTIKVDGEGLGFRRPQGVVPGGVSFTINDSFLWLAPGRPRDDVAYSMQFMRAVSDIYDRLPKPPTAYTDWPFEIAPQTAKDLLDPINGVSAGGTRLLKAYVGERERHLESIVSLDVLVPARKYARVFGAGPHLARLISDLEKGLPYWYLPLGGAKVFGNFPYPKREQDAWYFIYPLVQATELALEGNAEAKAMVLGSAAKLIEVGRAMDYEFPFMLDVVDNRRANDTFREYDTLGGYAYVMLGCHQVTGEAKYLEEAKKAVEHVRGKGFGFTYEPHFTAITLEALGWLYQLTGDARYMDLSYIGLANIFAMTWLWEPDYGYSASYTLFLGINPVPSADQVAAFEIHNVWWYLSRFYLRAEGALPPHVRKLLAEFLKYQLTVGRFTLPRFLPEEALSKTPDWGVIRRDMAIPVEDLKDGFHKSAMVGQEIYGAGEVFRFAADAYRVFGPGRELVLYAEYPVTAAEWNESASTLEFSLGGVPEYTSRVRLYFRGARGAAAAGAAVEPAGWPYEARDRVRVERRPGYIEFDAQGGSRYRVVLDPGAQLKATMAAGTSAPVAAPPSARVAAILGAAGVVQVEAGSFFSVPVVVTNPASSPARVSLEAELPTGWRMEALRLDLAPGASESRTLRVRAPADLDAGTLNQIAIRMRYAGGRSTVLETMVRRAANTDGAIREDFDRAAVWLQPVNETSRLSVADGAGSFTSLSDGVAGFESKVLTVDVDKHTHLDFDVLSLGGQFAVKIYEAGGSPFGTYVLPQIPVVPELPVKGLVRINLRERTGWSGIHSFKIGLYVVGRKGDTLRLDGWGISPGV